jgi:restriction system protein
LLLVCQEWPWVGAIASVAAFGLGAYLKWIRPDALFGAAPLIAIPCWIVAAAALFAMGIGLLKRKTRQDRFHSLRTPDDLRSLSWRQFEQAIADLFRRQGFRVQETGGSQPDGGVDLILRDLGGAEHLVQCKQYRTWSVGEPKVREFYGAMAAHRTRCEGIFVTCGRFTEPARRFAHDKPIRLIDGDELLQLLASVNPESPAVEVFTQLAAVDQAPVRDSHTSQMPPVCPRCNLQMVRRVAKRGPNAGTAFWGCPNFPDCRQTVDILNG